MKFEATVTDETGEVFNCILEVEHYSQLLLALSEKVPEDFETEGKVGIKFKPIEKDSSTEKLTQIDFRIGDGNEQ